MLQVWHQLHPDQAVFEIEGETAPHGCQLSLGNMEGGPASLKGCRSWWSDRDSVWHCTLLALCPGVCSSLGTSVCPAPHLGQRQANLGSRVLRVIKGKLILFICLGLLSWMNGMLTVYVYLQIWGPAWAAYQCQYQCRQSETPILRACPGLLTNVIFNHGNLRLQTWDSWSEFLPWLLTNAKFLPKLISITAIWNLCKAVLLTDWTAVLSSECHAYNRQA